MPKRRVNPDHPDVKKARKLYEDFRERVPRRARAVNVEWPKVLTLMGTVREIKYDTTIRGKSEKFVHTFADGSAPFMCVDPQTKQLYLVGGRYHVVGAKRQGGETYHGIVDIDAKGNDILDD
jgi:hypothetical protein